MTSLDLPPAVAVFDRRSQADRLVLDRFRHCLALASMVIDLWT
jgi:hypothetical protein